MPISRLSACTQVYCSYWYNCITTFISFSCFHRMEPVATGVLKMICKDHSRCQCGLFV